MASSRPPSNTADISRSASAASQSIAPSMLHGDRAWPASPSSAASEPGSKERPTPAGSSVRGAGSALAIVAPSRQLALGLVHLAGAALVVVAMGARGRPWAGGGRAGSPSESADLE